MPRIGVGIGVGFGKSGVRYGPELNTLANAISPINEADAITGFTEVGLNGTGANVFQSQGSEKTNGSYGFEINTEDTPTSAARIYVDLEAAPFNLVNGDLVVLLLDAMHSGNGGNWRVALSSNGLSLDDWFTSLTSAETSWLEKGTTFTKSATSRYLMFIEGNGPGDGQIYIDNLSLKKTL